MIVADIQKRVNTSLIPMWEAKFQEPLTNKLKNIVRMFATLQPEQFFPEIITRRGPKGLVAWL